MPSSAYLLVAHGSRDARPPLELAALAQKFALELTPSAYALSSVSSLPSSLWDGERPWVGTACLELQPQPLHQQIQDFATGAIAAHYSRLQIVPLFLLPGVHVMDDIPREVAIAQKRLGDQIQLQIRPYLGQYSHLTASLGQILPPRDRGTAVLLSHGSRRPGGNAPVEDLARALGATTAYWSVPPHLDEQVNQLVQQGWRDITIVPYVLFPAGITDAIAVSLETYVQRYPAVQFRRLAPLCQSAPVVRWLMELLNLVQD